MNTKVVSSFSINIPLLPEVDKRMKEQLRTQPSPTQELPDTPVKTDEDELREDATWGVWVSTRTTPFVCEASSREEAISKLRKSSVAGHDAKVVSARQLEGSSLRKARRGEWVRERANGESNPRLGGSRHVSAASLQEIEGVALAQRDLRSSPEGESTGGKSKVRPWLFDEDDTLAHFSAGLISRIDALEMLGYENAEELAGRFDQEFLEQTKSSEEVKADDIVFPSDFQGTRSRSQVNRKLAEWTQDYKGFYEKVGFKPLDDKPGGAGSPSDREWVGENKTSANKFHNKRAELWDLVRERFRKTYNHVNGIATYPFNELISIPDDPTLIAQLSTPLEGV